MTRNRVIPVLGTCLVLALVPVSAHAAAVSIVAGPAVSVLAPNGEANRVTISADATDYLIEDLGAALTASGPCATVDANHVTCPLVSATTVTVFTQDLADTVSISGAFAWDAEIDTGPGDDFLDGGEGADSLSGGSGTDSTVYSRAAPVTVTLDDIADDGETGEGDNVHSDVENVFGGSEVDNFTGGSNANVFLGGGGNDYFDGGGGDDYFDGGTGADDINGGPGNDRVTYSLWGTFGVDGVNVTVDGVADDGSLGEGDNIRTDVENVTGSPGDDVIVGSPVANTLEGNGGNDSLQGGGGADRLLGETGDDALDGGAGADTLNGGGDDDSLDGATGDDSLDGGTGADDLNGGADQDTATYRTRDQPVSITIDDAADDGEVAEGDNVHSDVENVTGGDGNDTLAGSAIANLLDGGPGDDALDGGDGLDTLRGAAGADALNSRDSFADVLACGPEADTVVADRSDSVAVDCESVDLPALPTGPGATPEPAPKPTPFVSPLPAVKITVRKVTATIAPDGSAAIPIPVICPATETAGCTGRVSLSIPTSSAKAPEVKTSRRGRRPTLHLATREFTAPADSTISVKVPLSKTVVRRLRKPARRGGAPRRSVKLTLAASQRGGDGLVRTLKRSVVVRLA